MQTDPVISIDRTKTKSEWARMFPPFRLNVRSGAAFVNKVFLIILWTKCSKRKSEKVNKVQFVGGNVDRRTNLLTTRFFFLIVASTFLYFPLCRPIFGCKVSEMPPIVDCHASGNRLFNRNTNYYTHDNFRKKALIEFQQAVLATVRMIISTHPHLILMSWSNVLLLVFPLLK